MAYRMADIAFPPDPATLVADLNALGCDAVGLYVVNWAGVPGAVRSADYVHAVLARGKQVLPIISSGDGPGPTLAVLNALLAWGVPGCPVAFDVEHFSEPSSGWLDSAMALLEQHGFFPGMYGPASDQARYSGDPFKWRWLARWTFTDTLPPPPYVAIQWTDQGRGPSGTTYDLSDVDSSLVLLGGIMALDQSDKDWIVQTLGIGVGQSDFAGTIRALLGTDQSNFNSLAMLLADVTAEGGKLDQILAAVQTLPGGQVPQANVQPIMDGITAIRNDLASLTLKKV
jgi:hypothetical protein